MDAQAELEPHLCGCAVPRGYTGLLDSAVDVLRADERVRAAWVHGSVARGDADAVSDLDVIIAVEDSVFTEFASGWRARLDAITPTVMARASFGGTGSWLAITPSCQRFDLWVEPASLVANSVVRDRHVLFDHDALTASVPTPAVPAGPSTHKLDRLRETFADALAVAAVADELLQIEVVHALRWSLYEAYLESNRPIPTTGLKRWSSKLTAAQLAVFNALPTRGDPLPVIDALQAALGETDATPREPTLAKVVIPPEGAIRGLSIGTAEPGTWSRHLAEEFLAIHLYLTVVVHREDWLLGLDGVSLQRKLLYELYLEENGRSLAVSPADWSARLASEQREELLRLPTGEPNRESVVAANLAVRHAFIRRGQSVLAGEWPAEMDHAICDHVDAFIR